MDTPRTENSEAAAELRASLYADLLTYDQACEALGGISRYTLSRLVSDGKLDAVVIRNRRFIAHSVLAEYIRELREGARRPSAVKSAVA